MARKNDRTDQIDMIVGERIREQRISLGLSRMQLAAKIDVTHQQLQKYEKGDNRVSAGRLYLIAEALNKPLNYFFNGELDVMPEKHQRMCIEVSRNFMKIDDPSHQNAVNILVKTLSGN